MKAVITILECNSASVVSHIEQKLLSNKFILKKCDGRKTTAHTFVTGAICWNIQGEKCPFKQM